MTAAPTVADVLRRVTADPGRPRLTWYGAGGERIELSGAVLANWVAKTTNLLVEEFDAGPGIRIGLDLPAHWRTVVWALAAWRCGAEVVVGEGEGGGGGADVVVTDRPARYRGARQLVAVALPALARAFDGDLPPGAVDAAGAVMTYGDVVGWAPDVDPAGAALTVPGGPGGPSGPGGPGGPSGPGGPGEPSGPGGPGGAVRHAGLVAWAVDGAPGPGTPLTPTPATASATTPAPASGGPTSPGARRLVPAGPDRTGDAAALLRAVLGALAADGSVVVLGSDVVAELDADPDRRARLVAGERVTDE